MDTLLAATASTTPTNDTSPSPSDSPTRSTGSATSCSSLTSLMTNGGLSSSDLVVTLLQKRRGNGGLWQPLLQDECIRVDKAKGKLLKLLIKPNANLPNNNSDATSNGTTSDRQETRSPTTTTTTTTAMTTTAIDLNDKGWEFQVYLVDKSDPEVPSFRLDKDSFTIEPIRPPNSSSTSSSSSSSSSRSNARNAGLHNSSGGLTSSNTKEFKMKITKISKRQYFFVSATRGDFTITGCSLEFRSEDNGKVALPSKKRYRQELELEAASSLSRNLCKDICSDNHLVNLIAKSLAPMIRDNLVNNTTINNGSGDGNSNNSSNSASNNSNLAMSLEDNIAKRIKMAFANDAASSSNTTTTTTTSSHTKQLTQAQR